MAKQMRLVTRYPFVVAALAVIVAFVAAGALRSIGPDVSVVCYPPYGEANCTESRRSARIDLAAIFVVLSGLAGAAAIIVARRRRTQSLARLFAVCLAITGASYAAFVLVVLALI